MLTERFDHKGEAPEIHGNIVWSLSKRRKIRRKPLGLWNISSISFLRRCQPYCTSKVRPGARAAERLERHRDRKRVGEFRRLNTVDP
jgi:hypothetical protein